MQHFISPNFTHEKLESPNYEDLVDVFEDRMRNWLLIPASSLLDTQHCQIAGVSLLISYFEGIEIYLVGEDSRNRSGEFFVNAFNKVFDVSAENEKLIKKVADAVYSQARCGFAHDAMFRNRVFFSETPTIPILATWPKKNGEFDTNGELESIVINPRRLFESIEVHFSRYINQLRAGTNTELVQAFQKAVKLKWGLDEPDRVIGLTEEEFHKT